MKYILAAIATPMVVFLFTAFTNWNFDMSQLATYERFVMAFVTLMSWVVITFWVGIDKEGKQ